MVQSYAFSPDMPPIYQLFPFRLAVTIYSATRASNMSVVSQIVGKDPSSSMKSGSIHPCEGLPEKTCIGLSYTINIASCWQRVVWLITFPQIGLNIFGVALSNNPGS